MPQAERRRGTREIAPVRLGAASQRLEEVDPGPRPFRARTRPLRTRLPALFDHAPCAYGTPGKTKASFPLSRYSLLTRDLGEAVGREGSRRRTEHGGGGGAGDGDGGGADGDDGGVSSVVQGGGRYSVRLSGGK